MKLVCRRHYTCVQSPLVASLDPVSLVLCSLSVGLLESFGLLLGISNTILGLTVLAWGNSLGDLVADVTVAKEGLPAMAIAGCFAGPMFSTCEGGVRSSGAWAGASCH